MEIALSCERRPLKPGKEAKSQERGHKKKKNKLRSWKRLGALRYRIDSGEEPSVDKSNTKDVSVIAFCRSSEDQARLYSLHSREGSLNAYRKKSKLFSASVVEISSSGQFAVAALKAEGVIRIFDLSSTDHPCVAEYAFPELTEESLRSLRRSRSGNISLRRRSSKADIVGLPGKLWIDDNGKTVVAERADNGEIWIRIDNEESWRLVPLNSGSPSIVALRFEKSMGTVELSQGYVARGTDKFVFALTSTDAGISRGAKPQIFRSNRFERDVEFQFPKDMLSDEIVCGSFCALQTRGKFVAQAINLNEELKHGSLLLIRKRHSDVCTVVELNHLLGPVKVCEICWTSDDVFLALALGDGSISIFSAAGFPIHLVDQLSKRPKPRLAMRFRNLETYEEEGKVPTHFGITSHPQKGELTWCDGNRNLVHISLPTEPLEVRTRTDAVVPFVSSVQTLLGWPSASADENRQFFQGISHSTGTTVGSRALQAWILSTRMGPCGWTAAEHDAVRASAGVIISILAAVETKRDDPDGLRLLQSFARVAGTSDCQEFQAEEVFLSRFVVNNLIRENHLYAALHVLRMAESTYAEVSQRVAFDRHWLLVGALAAKNGHAPLAKSVLAYVQQRARSWTFFRAETNIRRTDVVLDGIKKDTKIIKHVWKGDDMFLRGFYDEAEDEYEEDEHGAFPLMCLLMRRMKLEKAVKIATEWLRERNKLRRSAFSLLGRVIAGTFLQRSALLSVPSPCCHVTSRTTRQLKFDVLSKRALQCSTWTVHLGAILLLKANEKDLAFELLSSSKDYESLLIVMDTFGTKIPDEMRFKLWNRHLIVQLYLGNMQACKNIVDSILRNESSEKIRISLAWVLLLKVFQIERGTVKGGFIRRLRKQGRNQNNEDLHASCALSALRIIWDGSNCDSTWEGLLFDPAPSSKSLEEWFSVLRAAVAVFGGIEGIDRSSTNEFAAEILQALKAREDTRQLLLRFQESDPRFLQEATDLVLSGHFTEKDEALESPETEVNVVDQNNLTRDLFASGSGSDIQNTSSLSHLETEIKGEEKQEHDGDFESISSPLSSFSIASDGQCSERCDSLFRERDGMEPSPHSEEEAQEDIELESPWIFMGKDRNQLREEVGSTPSTTKMEVFLEQQKAMFEEAMKNILQHEQMKGHEVLSAISKRVDFLTAELLNYKDLHQGRIADSDSFSQSSEESIEGEDLDEDDESCAGNEAARKFLQNAGFFRRRKHPREESPLSEEESSECEPNADVMKLRGLPPTIPGVPPLLSVHPATQQTARGYKIAQRRVCKTNMTTQTSLEFIATKKETESKGFVPAQTPEKAAAMTQADVLERVSEETLVKLMKDTGDQSVSLRVALPEENLGKASLIRPRAHPQLYLNVDADGKRIFSTNWSQNQARRHFIHVAPLSKSSPCFTDLQPIKRKSTKTRWRPRLVKNVDI